MHSNGIRNRTVAADFGSHIGQARLSDQGGAAVPIPAANSVTVANARVDVPAATLAGAPSSSALEYLENHRSLGRITKPTTWDELFRSVAAAGANLTRIPLPFRSLRVELDRLAADGHAWKLSGAGLKRLCRQLGAPGEYLAKLPGTLRSDLLQHHLTDGNGLAQLTRGDEIVVIARHDEFVSLARADLYDLSAIEVLNAVREGIGAAATAELEVPRLVLHEEGWEADLASAKVFTEVRPGDIVRGGLHVEHSFIGAQATVIMAYAYRLVCSNGLTRRACLGEKSSTRSTPRTRRLSLNRGGARERQLDQVRRQAATTWARLNEKLDAIHQLRDKEGDLAHDLIPFLRQARMASADVLAVVQAAWVQEGSELTGFGMLNALTRAASHEITVQRGKRAITLSPSQRRALSRLAGVYAYHQRHVCPHCLSVIRN